MVTVPGALACWLQWLLAGRPALRGDALFFLLVLLGGERLWAPLLGVRRDLVGGPKDRNRAPVQAPEGSCCF